MRLQQRSDAKRGRTSDPGWYCRMMSATADSLRRVHLTKRFGHGVPDPTEPELADALRELFDPTVDDEEHGAAWLSYAIFFGKFQDEGPEFIVTFTCNRIARFEEWADHDFDEALATEREARDVTNEEALTLWKLLASGDLDAVRSWRWRSPTHGDNA